MAESVTARYTGIKTYKTSHKEVDRIASEHGCDIATGGNGSLCIDVQRQWSQGDPLDSARKAECRQAIEAAGISTTGWLS